MLEEGDAPLGWTEINCASLPDNTNKVEKIKKNRRRLVDCGHNDAGFTEEDISGLSHCLLSWFHLILIRFIISLVLFNWRPTLSAGRAEREVSWGIWAVFEVSMESVLACHRYITTVSEWYCV